MARSREKLMITTYTPTDGTARVRVCEFFVSHQEQEHVRDDN